MYVSTFSRVWYVKWVILVQLTSGMVLGFIFFQSSLQEILSHVPVLPPSGFTPALHVAAVLRLLKLLQEEAFDDRRSSECRHCLTLCLLCSRVMTYREHGAWVVKAHLQKETDGHIISVRYGLFVFFLFLFRFTSFPYSFFVACTDFDAPHQC